MLTLKSAFLLGMSLFLVSCFADTAGRFDPDAGDSVTGENCTNGVDDDGDDFVDCEDQDCWEQPACSPDASTDSDDTIGPELPPDAPIGALYVESTPDGASLSVDSLPYGATPITIEVLLAGHHTASLALDGFYEWEDTVEVPEDDILSLDIELEEVPAYWVDISGTWIREGTGGIHTITQTGDIVSGFPGGDIVMDWSFWTISPVVIDDHYMQYGNCVFDVVPMRCEFCECIEADCYPEQSFFKSS